MTPEYADAVRESGEAELRGDAATAAQLHRSVPMFRHSSHGDRLELIAGLGDSAPGWLVSRWLTVMALRRGWTGGDEQRTRMLLEFVVPLIYPHGIPFERLGCTWVEQVMPYIWGRDWVVRQVDLYEMYALRDVVHRHASPELLERADQVEEWCVAPMRACRLEASEAARTGSLRVTDLTTSEALDVLDLGASETMAAGDCFLARIVPTVAGPGAMFDWRPLPVPERAAVAVARNPERWLSTMHGLAMASQLAPAYSHQLESSITSDLPRHAWMTLAGVADAAIADTDPADVVGRALREALALADRGAETVAGHRHHIGDLLLDVSLGDRLLLRFARPGLTAAWRVLGETVPAPAQSRCLEMAMWSDAGSDDDAPEVGRAAG